MLNAILIGRRLLMIIMIYYDISLRTPRFLSEQINLIHHHH